MLCDHFQIANTGILCQECSQCQSIVVLLLVVQVGGSLLTIIASQAQLLVLGHDFAVFKVNLCNDRNLVTFNQLINHINSRLIAQLSQIHGHEFQDRAGVDLGRILDQAIAQFYNLLSQFSVITDNANGIQILQCGNILSQSVRCIQHLLLGSHILVADGQIQRISDFYAEVITRSSQHCFVCTLVHAIFLGQRQVLVTLDGSMTVRQIKCLRGPNSTIGRILVDLCGNRTGFLVYRDQVVCITGHLIIIRFVRIQNSRGDDCNLLVAEPINVFLDEHAKRCMGIVIVSAFSSKHVQRRTGQHHNHCQHHRHESLGT